MNAKPLILTTEGRTPRRDPLIDGLRGIAIILVVLGHSIQHHLTGFNSNIIVKAIYSFHMPLFIALSGYLAFGRLEVPFLHLIRRKAAQLVVPFLAWHLVTYLIAAVHHATLSNPIDWYRTLFISPDMGLWFLWVLFLCFAVASLSARLPRRFHEATLLGSAFLLYLVNYQAGGMALLRWLFPFFVAGYLFAKHEHLMQHCPLRLIAIASPILWVIMVPFFSSNNPMPIETIYANWGIPGVSWFGLLFRYGIAGMGIIALVAVLATFTRGSIAAIPRWLMFVGAASMDIYVSHQYFTAYPKGLVGLHVIPVAFIFGIAGSLCLSFLALRHSAWLRCLFLGIRQRRDIY